VDKSGQIHGILQQLQNARILGGRSNSRILQIPQQPRNTYGIQP